MDGRKSRTSPSAPRSSIPSIGISRSATSTTKRTPSIFPRHYVGAYRARLNANLAFFDGLDGKVDWPLDPHGNHPLTELLLADFLVVDTSKPFSETGYFEIEQAILEGRPHASCGGRWLNEDLVDFLLTLYVNAGKGPRIRDGVDGPIAWSSKVFPYMATPNRPEAASS